MKNIIFPVVVLVVVMIGVLAVYGNMNTSTLKKALDGERYKRITTEQQLQKANQQIASLEQELGKVKSKMTSIEKILHDGRELAIELEAIKKDRELLKQQIESLTSQEAVSAVTAE